MGRAMVFILISPAKVRIVFEREKERIQKKGTPFARCSLIRCVDYWLHDSAKQFVGLFIHPAEGENLLAQVLY